MEARKELNRLKLHQGKHSRLSRRYRTPLSLKFAMTCYRALHVLKHVLGVSLALNSRTKIMMETNASSEYWHFAMRTVPTRTKSSVKRHKPRS